MAATADGFEVRFSGDGCELVGPSQIEVGDYSFVVTNTVSDEGTANTTVTGDQGEFILGKTVAGGAHEIGTWLTERQAQSFDAIFVAAGEPLVVHLDVTLPIDYDPAGRKLDYHARLNGPGGAYGYLD